MKKVEKAYDKMAKSYEKTRHQYKNEPILKKFSSQLPKNAKVLDIGCGAGKPVAEYFAKKEFDTTGIDISQKMIELAKKNVPKAKFYKKDMLKATMPKAEYDGITAFYSIIHIPKEKHKIIFKKIYNSLKPKGTFLMSTGMEDYTGKGEFHNETMYWSYNSPEKTKKLLEETGFKIIWTKKDIQNKEKHYWIMARKQK